ncbi:MAG: D-alanine--D-alanine ligase [Clostridia bacterium]|nr:D-alanine--D-alanine ligase [Clostridia bacterium]
MKNILVFFGGVSCEHDVSVITGTMVANSLKGGNFDPIPIFVDENGEWYGGKELFDIGFCSSFDEKKVYKVTVVPGDDALYRIKNRKLKKISKADVAINCLHGLNGEDGSLAGLLQLSGIPLASPSLFASSLSMDKYYTKLLLAGLNVACAPYVRICRDNYERGKEFALDFVKKKLEFPVIVKPANLGSSIGITKVSDEGKLIDALDRAFKYDGKVVVEKAFEGFREINCACYKSGDKYFVSECEEPLLNGDLLSFADKYNGEGVKNFPAEIEPSISKKIKETVKYVYRKLDFKGVIRIDFLLVGNEVYLNEINSVPGSLAYYLFCSSTDQLSEFVERLCVDAINERQKFDSNLFKYKSGILNAGFFGKGKTGRGNKR